jgi:hypothetical protein
VVRCGVSQPAGYDPTSPQAATVNGIAWFQQVGHDTVTWTAVRPGAAVELIVPRSYDAQGGFLVELGSAMKRADL